MIRVEIVSLPTLLSLEYCTSCLVALKDCLHFRYPTSTSSRLLQIVTMQSGPNNYLKSKFMGVYIRTPRLVLRIEDHIGSGRFGDVFRATETSSGGSFAVKIVPKTPYWALEAIYHGVLAEHPNIITLHSISENEDFGFLVLDYCDGLDLHRSVHYSRAFAGDTDAIKHVFLQIVDAVQHCHQNTVYHRDLKLENVLYDPRTGQAFLTDFGVSTDDGWSTEYRAGTVRIISPGGFKSASS